MGPRGLVISTGIGSLAAGWVPWLLAATATPIGPVQTPMLTRHWHDYTANRATRIVTGHLGPGGYRINGALSHLVGFSMQSGHMLLTARKRNILSASEQRLALLESSIMAAAWCALGIGIGLPAFAFWISEPQRDTRRMFPSQVADGSSAAGFTTS
jgi:hypothetical protein